MCEVLAASLVLLLWLTHLCSSTPKYKRHSSVSRDRDIFNLIYSAYHPTGANLLALYEFLTPHTYYIAATPISEDPFFYPARKALQLHPETLFHDSTSAHISGPQDSFWDLLSLPLPLTIKNGSRNDRIDSDRFATGPSGQNQLNHFSLPCHYVSPKKIRVELFHQFQSPTLIFFTLEPRAH